MLVEGQRRARISGFISPEPYFEAEAELLEEEIGAPDAVEAMTRTLADEFEKYVKLNKSVPDEALGSIADVDSPSRLADTIAGHLSVKLSEKQSLLETLSVEARLERIYGLIQGEISVLKVEKKIKSRVKTQMEKTQREYYLNEQMKAIQRELGEGDDGRDEIGDYEDRIDAAKLTKEAHDKALAELKKLRNMAPMSAEATVVRNYLDWMLSIPWSKRSRVKKDLANAEKILDDDHFGLEKVKERIIEFLAVQKRSTKLRGPILCLVGPPGVGKTSLGKSVAKAIGRKFVRISLGGVRDEAEIRGHRRTYVGSLPGRLVQGLKRAGTNNPVIVLDEIDKLGHDFRGDPASALLEVLDPAQNHSFRDHYLEFELDLSDVVFLATANVLDTIPGPLLDRMEVIRLDGYTEREKATIARRHLLPRLVEDNGLDGDDVSIDDAAIATIAGDYTREAGVRGLERLLDKAVRKAATKLATGAATAPVRITDTDLRELLGRPIPTETVDQRVDRPGIATGLAVTGAGGDVLFVETALVDGDGEAVLTGQLGDVMKESASIARSVVAANQERFGVTVPTDKRLHVHFPAGAVPKDGPSAGVTMTTALVSLLSGRTVKPTIGMTGEVTLQGRVLAIGGVKQKVLAAHRAGLTEVILPAANGDDLEDVPDDVLADLTVHLADDIGQVLDWALTPAS